MPHTFTVDDNAGSGPVTMNFDIVVTPVNDPPTADDFTATIDEEATVSGLLTFDDLEDAALTWTVATPPALGTLDDDGANLPSFVYTGGWCFWVVGCEGKRWVV